MAKQISIGSLVFVAGSVLACGGGRPAADASSSTDSEAQPATPGPSAEAYDASGQGHGCEPPSPKCSPRTRDLKFLDACRLSGYRVQRCGCDELCSGKVDMEKPHYDAQGHAKPCGTEQADCSPPDTSAAFQDACNDRGYKLVLCGCEYLCTGDFTAD